MVTNIWKYSNKKSQIQKEFGIDLFLFKEVLSFSAG
jgi:hypothetical protein